MLYFSQSRPPLYSDLKYAAKSDTAWSIETVGTDGLYFAASLVLDSQNNPHLCYVDADNILKYAVKSGAAWKFEDIDVGNPAGNGLLAGTLLALDIQGTPHICYYFDLEGELKYAAKLDGRWNLETIDAAGDVGRCPSIAVHK